ncbi:hypothetical protein [Thermococcus sp. LS2]|nr:hypothetical protein [Thermococcus sp. LS2]
MGFVILAIDRKVIPILLLYYHPDTYCLVFTTSLEVCIRGFMN